MCERILQLSRSSSHALSAHRGGRSFYGEVVLHIAGVAKPFVVELRFVFSGEGDVVFCAAGALKWDKYHTPHARSSVSVAKPRDLANAPSNLNTVFRSPRASTKCTMAQIGSIARGASMKTRRICAIALYSLAASKQAGHIASATSHPPRCFLR